MTAQKEIEFDAGRLPWADVTTAASAWMDGDFVIRTLGDDERWLGDVPEIDRLIDAINSLATICAGPRYAGEVLSAAALNEEFDNILNWRALP